MVLQEFSKDIVSNALPEDRQKLTGILEDACRQLLNSPNVEDGDASHYQAALSWVERPLIVEALRLTGGNRAKAADKLGIHRNTLRTRLKTLNID